MYGGRATSNDTGVCAGPAHPGGVSPRRLSPETRRARDLFFKRLAAVPSVGICRPKLRQLKRSPRPLPSCSHRSPTDASRDVRATDGSRRRGRNHRAQVWPRPVSSTSAQRTAPLGRGFRMVMSCILGPLAQRRNRPIAKAPFAVGERCVGERCGVPIAVRRGPRCRGLCPAARVAAPSCPGRPPNAHGAARFVLSWYMMQSTGVLRS